MLDTLKSLTTCITRLNRYIELLPDQPALHACMRQVCDEYVGFCISAILFREKSRWFWVYTVTCRPMNEKFQDAKAKIDGHIHQFEKEASLEIASITLREIRTLQQAPSAQPTNVKPSPVFKVDFAQNKFFTGRETEVSLLCEHVQNARKDGERGICTIHSMGGMGKTQLALEYAYRFRAELDCVFWMPAEHGPRLAQVFADIWTAVAGEAGSGPGQDASSPPIALPDNLAATVLRTKEWLRVTARPWLLIYDNVEDWDTIKPYWPSGNSGTILITSQRSDLVQISGGCEIPLSPLPPQEGRALLMKHLRKEPSNSAQDIKLAVSIAGKVGGLPVAISHIAGYIEKPQSTLDCQSWTHQYHQTLETTRDIALHELSTKSRALLNILAMLDAEYILEDLLFSNPALALIIRLAFPRQSDIQAPSNQNWLANEACLGHALHLGNAPNGFPELLADVSNYMWERGLYERGIITGQLAKRIHKEHQSEASEQSHDLIEHSKICTLLSGIYLELGISGREGGLAEALEAWEPRRQIRALSCSTDEMTQENLLLVANSWNDIACCMMEYGCYDTAEAWLSKSLELKRDLDEDGVAFFNYAENFKTWPS
ncbi:P-loop containing nucleoside triphosphate hydrolase protein [Schizothecium vesticola]|uniref:P-loop containing nucleoside triphosphate hydrolase protein n=1 Tax=Schizothecium vesticola TaxID=314040 RepID=A0AA40EUD7_9PEZI|nr:P-loop containing nucleoside triphosphate hydrolase protein [Schizothecium vesticola]